MSNYVDTLNDLTAGQKAADGFTQHPEGQYQGVIGTITQKEHNGRPLWNMPIKTTAGTAQFTIWGFSEQDINAAQQSTDHKERVLKNIGRTKRLFVDVGLAEPKSWSQGGESILGLMPQLTGRPCTVVVQKNINNPGKMVTFINAPATTANATGGGQNTTTSPPTAQGTPGVGELPNLDEIPF